MTKTPTTLAQARADALAAGTPAHLVDEAEKSARGDQDWGSFCWAWQEEIKGYGDRLRAVHAAARRELPKPCKVGGLGVCLTHDRPEGRERDVCGYALRVGKDGLCDVARGGPEGASCDTVRCEICTNEVAITEAVEQPYDAEETPALAGSSWWACRACFASTAQRVPDAALLAEAVEALRAVGMGKAADEITAGRPTSDVLAPAAQRLAFWIATERGDDKTRRALRAVAALAEQAGSGKRMRTTIGKEWGRALSWMQKPRPEEPKRGRPTKDPHVVAARDRARAGYEQLLRLALVPGPKPFTWSRIEDDESLLALWTARADQVVREPIAWLRNEDPRLREFARGVLCAGPSEPEDHASKFARFEARLGDLDSRMRALEPCPKCPVAASSLYPTWWIEYPHVWAPLRADGGGPIGDDDPTPREPTTLVCKHCLTTKAPPNAPSAAPTATDSIQELARPVVDQARALAKLAAEGDGAVAFLGPRLGSLAAALDRIERALPKDTAWPEVSGRVSRPSYFATFLCSTPSLVSGAMLTELADAYAGWAGLEDAQPGAVVGVIPRQPTPARVPVVAHPPIVTTPEDADRVFGKASGVGDAMRDAADRDRQTPQIAVVALRDAAPESQRASAPPPAIDDPPLSGEVVPEDTSPLTLPKLAPEIAAPPRRRQLVEYIRSRPRNLRLEHVGLNESGEVVEFDVRSYVEAKYGSNGIAGFVEDPAAWLGDLRSFGMLQHALDIGGEPMARALLGLPGSMTPARAVEMIQANPPHPTRTP